ncbi:hypothetical protein AAFF_G00083600, partial [Aldrovandia affinis]
STSSASNSTCYLPIPVHVSSSRLPRRRDSTHTRNLSNLIYPPRSPGVDVVVAGGLWNCQSAVRKADLISAQASLLSLQFLALTETWITPQNTATPAALSAAYTFSHIPRPSGRGGGTGILISPLWRFGIVPLPHPPPLNFMLSLSLFHVNCTSLFFIALQVHWGVSSTRWMPSSVPSLRMALPSYSSGTSTCHWRPLRPLHSSPCFSPLTSPWLNPHPPTMPNNLLDPNQSGFRAGHSTETALLAVTEALHGAKSQSLSSALLLLDLSAAFDTVDHRILLSSLVKMGISGSALTWFESYLADRSYQVAWRGSLSSPHTLSTGVPRGSVLGPVLFSLYTKSLGSVISAHGFSYHCYADDTQLFLSFSPSDIQVPAWISACLADISAWMSAQHLKLNLGKTERRAPR